MKNTQGFTLIELMIVVAIIAVIATIAIPAYQDYVVRSKIPDGTSFLANKRVLMEQFYQDNRTYASASPCTSALTSPEGYFTLTCPTLNATAYTLLVTGSGAMAGFTYQVDQSNNKSSAIASPAPSSWIGAQGSCWITKKGAQC